MAKVTALDMPDHPFWHLVKRKYDTIQDVNFRVTCPWCGESHRIRAGDSKLCWKCEKKRASMGVMALKPLRPIDFLRRGQGDSE